MERLIVETVPDKEFVQEVNLTVIIISLAICIFGIFGNSIAIFVIVVLKEYQKSITNWYILHLAIADSVFLLTLPFQVSSELNQVWIYPEWLCKAKETILFCNYYASILFLVVMSVDRYVAVCQTFTVFSKWLRKRETAWMITAAVWTIALLLCIPVMLYSATTGDYPKCQCSYVFPKPLSTDCDREGIPEIMCDQFMQKQEDRLHCTPTLGNESITMQISPLDLFNQLRSSRNKSTIEHHGLGTQELSGDGSGSGLDSSTVVEDVDIPILKASCHYEDQPSGFILLLQLNFWVMFILPLAVMIVCYGLIIWKLSATGVQTATPSSSFTPTSVHIVSKFQSQKKKSLSRSQIDRRRVTIMCAALVACFVICWLPFHGIHLAKITGIRDTKTEVCQMLFKFGSLLAYLNSALNPYLYSFLGTNFSKRWKTASNSFRRTISRSRAQSTGSFASVRQFQNRNGERKTSNTGITKLSKAYDAKPVSPTEVVPQPTFENLKTAAPDSSINSE